MNNDTKYDIIAEMHFSSFIDVGESVRNPEKYYHNNVVNTMNLLNVMLKHDVKKDVEKLYLEYFK